MSRSLRLLAAMTLAALSVSSGQARANFTIDPFTAQNFAGINFGGTSPTTSSSGVSETGAFGGNQVITVTRTSGFSTVTGDSSFSAPNTFSLAVGSNTTGYASLIYDGSTSSTLNPSGIAATDVTQGGANTGLQIKASASTNGTAPVEVDAYFFSGSNEAKGVVQLAPNGTPNFSTYFVAFTNFTTVAGTVGSNFFQNITAIQVDVNKLGAASTLSNVGADVSFLFTSPPPAATPEPASVVMLGLGLVGVVGAARLRRKSA